MFEPVYIPTRSIHGCLSSTYLPPLILFKIAILRGMKLISLCLWFAFFGWTSIYRKESQYGVVLSLRYTLEFFYFYFCLWSAWYIRLYTICNIILVLGFSVLSQRISGPGRCVWWAGWRLSSLTTPLIIVCVTCLSTLELDPLKTYAFLVSLVNLRSLWEKVFLIVHHTESVEHRDVTQIAHWASAFNETKSWTRAEKEGLISH